MKIPPKGASENLIVTIIAGVVMIVVMLLVLAAVMFLPPKSQDDSALSNQQVLEKSQVCHKNGMAIQLIYDDEWKVYAVKCIYGGFTGDGRRKK